MPPETLDRLGEARDRRIHEGEVVRIVERDDGQVAGDPDRQFARPRRRPIVMTSLQERTAVGRDFSSILRKYSAAFSPEDGNMSPTKTISGRAGTGDRARLSNSRDRSRPTDTVVDGGMIPIFRCPD